MEVVMETLEVAGSWWMPRIPDHRVPGILTFDLRSAGRLKPIGGLRTPPDLAKDSTDASTYGRLHGQCEGRSFTLEGCFQLDLRGAPHAPDEQVIYVNNIYADVWFSADEEAEADVLHFDVDGLTEWVGQSGLEQTFYQSPADGEPWVKLEGVPLPEREAELPGRGRVTLGQKLSTKAVTHLSRLRRAFHSSSLTTATLWYQTYLTPQAISKTSSPWQRTQVRSSDS
jgi:hypothetical protein